MSCGLEKTSLLCLSAARFKCRSHSLSARSLAFARAVQGMGASISSLSWSELFSSNWCDGTCMMARSGWASWRLLGHVGLIKVSVVLQKTFILLNWVSSSKGPRYVGIISLWMTSLYERFRIFLKCCFVIAARECSKSSSLSSYSSVFSCMILSLLSGYAGLWFVALFRLCRKAAELRRRCRLGLLHKLRFFNRRVEPPLPILGMILRINVRCV